MRTQRKWWIVGIVVVLVAAAVIIWRAVSTSSSSARAFEVSRSECGKNFHSVKAGRQAIPVYNTDIAPVEVTLVNPRSGAVFGEVEELAPQSTRSINARVGDGAYALRCSSEGTNPITSPTVKVSGSGVRPGPSALPVTNNELTPVTKTYLKYIKTGLSRLVTEVTRLKTAVAGGNRAQAKKAWLTAHLQYERLGAAYGAFGDADGAINGTAAGLPKGAVDPGFTGFHRLEKGLWGTEAPKKLEPYAKRLVTDVTKLRKSVAGLQIDPLDMGLRAHEIMENTLQFELTGKTDYGSGSNLQTAQANIDGTKEVLKVLRPILKTRVPTMPSVDAQLARTEDAIKAGHDEPIDKLPQTQKERIDAAVSELTERLAPIAAVTEPRKGS